MYFFVYTIQVVVVHKFVNPIVTPLMIIRLAEGVMAGKDSVGIKKEWKALDEISIQVAYAVIASEDFNFFHHNGFNWKGIKRAMKYNEKHKGEKVRGASTISQQTAKNVFLFPSRTWIRKGIEVYFTFLIELIWSKDRIMEVYLNVMEMGDGVYGIESGAEVYFSSTSSNVTAEQAAALAAILPAPLDRSPTIPNRFVKRKIDEIRILMHIIESRPLDFPLEGFNKGASSE